MDVLPLSVLLLARDEAARLEVLLPRLSFAREVVVVIDQATHDRSREVATAAGARVVERALEDFGLQRRFGLEQCREPWVLWIDADEQLDEAGVAAVRAVVNAGPSATAPTGYRIERRTWFLGRRIRFSGWRGERVLRLFRREAASFEAAPVHEEVTVRGAIADLRGVLEHRSYESWTDCRDKLVRYAAAGAEKARQQGRGAGPLDVALRPPLAFARDYLLKGGVLDGGRGFAVCALGAAQVFLKYFELWLDPQGRRR